MKEGLEIPGVRSLLSGDYPNTLASVRWAFKQPDDQQVLSSILGGRRGPPRSEVKIAGGLEAEILVQRFVDRYRHMDTVLWEPGELDRLEASAALKPIDDLADLINTNIRELFARANRVSNTNEEAVVADVLKMSDTLDLITSTRSHLEALRQMINIMGNSQ